jgi:hypothetical protein
MSEEQRRPIGEVLPRFVLYPLADGWTPLDAYVLVKSLDEEGCVSWASRSSEMLNDEELLGALTVQVDRLRRRLVRQWDPDDADDL